ncbi:MAG TPA: GMC family oxidoreductase [Polyangiales bacterium]
MPVLDLFSSASGAASNIRACDVCIIGSGPAGATIAAELANTGVRTVLLESGGFTRREEVDALNDIENVGRARANQWAVRNRIVGGSSYTWGGRCAPFDEIDYEPRPWVPMSGWPIGPDLLTPYLDRSARHLGLAYGTGFNDAGFWSLAGRPMPTLPDPSVLRPFVWQFSRDEQPSYPYEYMRFGRHLTKHLGANVTLIAGATVLRIRTNESVRAVRSVEFAGPDGTRYTLGASNVILAAGGIENARLLLASDDIASNGLGNDRDLVGRYLMDHLRGPCASFELTGTEGLQKLYGRYTVSNTLFRAGLRLSPQVQRAEHLLNCSAWLGETLAEDDPWIAVRHVMGGRPSITDVQTIAQNAPLLLRGVRDYFIERNGAPRKLSALTLDVMVEQRPDPESRVTLSDRRDRFGIRVTRVDWRSHIDEARTMKRMTELVAEQFARLGLPVPVLADWVRAAEPVPESFVDVAHPTGTTRMSDDPRTGVVDRDCQVHGIEGLYVTGTSVFPTAGHCNPTQMIVALALRVADTVKARVEAAKFTPPRASPERTVLVTGGTGRIGRVLLEELLDRGYRVRATTSRDPAQLPAKENLEWVKFDFLVDEGFDQLVAGCHAVLHLAAEIGKKARMQRVNVDATRLLARAAEKEGVEAFCYTSSVAVYGSGLRREIAEDSPVLTVDRDVPSEYWALDYVREYGRTKLAGELALRQEAARTRYVILRPTVVVDVDDIINVREWALLKRVLGAHRHAHHIYVRDVADAVIWAIARARESERPGSVELFNLAEDEFGEPHHADFMQRAFALTGDARYRVLTTSWVGDWLHDFLRFRTLPLRNPLWRMNFSNRRLQDAGYFPRFGLAEAHSRALATLADGATS